jgi:hypothetical protein
LTPSQNHFKGSGSILKARWDSGYGPIIIPATSCSVAFQKSCGVVKSDLFQNKRAGHERGSAASAGHRQPALVADLARRRPALRRRRRQGPRSSPPAHRQPELVAGPWRHALVGGPRPSVARAPARARRQPSLALTLTSRISPLPYSPAQTHPPPSPTHMHHTQVTAAWPAPVRKTAGPRKRTEQGRGWGEALDHLEGSRGISRTSPSTAPRTTAPSQLRPRRRESRKICGPDRFSREFPKPRLGGGEGCRHSFAR